MNRQLASDDIDAIRSSPFVQQLEQALEAPLSVWRRVDDSWECADDGAAQDASSATTRQLVARCWENKRPLVEYSQSHTTLLGAIPFKQYSLRVDCVLVAHCRQNEPRLLTYALEQLHHSLQKERELETLREENSVFLKQVTEDFEELTFLRSMAENMALEDGNHALARLTNSTLSLLGQLIGVEYMFFVENGSDTLTVRAEWVEPTIDDMPFTNWQIEAVTHTLAKRIGDKPLVRNNVCPEDLGYGLAAIRQLVIVPVRAPQAKLGWLLAVNRSAYHEAHCSELGWRLSQHELGSRETSLLTTAAAILASHSNNIALLEERETLLVNVVRALVSAIDSRDPYTCGHSERVALYARRLAAEIGLDSDACEKIYLTGLLHDLGKIGISDSVLKKDGPLTKEEFDEIKRHPDLGWSILQGLEQFDYVLPGVLHHHERYDGKGYPDKLKGEETPLEGRLLAVVDSFDAMTSDRPYRAGMPVEKAIDILGEGAGSQWDARMVDAFLRILPDIEQIRIGYCRPPLPHRKNQNSQGQLSEQGAAAAV